MRESGVRLDGSYCRLPNSGPGALVALAVLNVVVSRPGIGDSAPIRANATTLSYDVRPAIRGKIAVFEVTLRRCWEGKKAGRSRRHGGHRAVVSNVDRSSRTQDRPRDRIYSKSWWPREGGDPIMSVASSGLHRALRRNCPSEDAIEERFAGRSWRTPSPSVSSTRRLT